MDSSFPTALTISALYSTGNRYAQVDLNTFNVLKVYGISVLTAILGNDFSINQHELAINSTIVNRQFGTILNEFNVPSCKIGYLPNIELITAVVQACRNQSLGVVVLDPVLFSDSGKPLLSEAAFSTYIKTLLPLADVITVDVTEAESLVDFTIVNDDDVIHAANELRGIGVQNVFIHGGLPEIKGEPARDYVLLANGDDFWLTDEDKAQKHTRSLSQFDALSACITAKLAQQAKVEMAIRSAKEFSSKLLVNPIRPAENVSSLNFWN